MRYSACTNTLREDTNEQAEAYTWELGFVALYVA